MARTAFAAAKLNLFLHVGPPEADGYHPVCTLMGFADVGDRVTLREAEAAGVTVTGPFAAQLAGERDNLVQRAAAAFFEVAGLAPFPIEIVLEKALPVAAGLGGGSADGGAVLRLLRGALAPHLADETLEAAAAMLGADGPACLWGRPALGEGRGDLLSPAPRLPEAHVVLVNPATPAPTGEVYRAFDSAGRFGAVARPPLPEAFEDVVELAAFLAATRNDLEAAAVSVAPPIGHALAALRDEPEALLARMSGSGATCFALCRGDMEAESLAGRLQALAPDWWVRAARLGGPWD